MEPSDNVPGNELKLLLPTTSVCQSVRQDRLRLNCTQFCLLLTTTTTRTITLRATTLSGKSGTGTQFSGCLSRGPKTLSHILWKRRFIVSENLEWASSFGLCSCCCCCCSGDGRGQMLSKFTLHMPVSMSQSIST